MKFKVIDFDLRVKPSKKEGHVLVIYSTEYLEEQTMEVSVGQLDYTLGMIFGIFKGTAVGEVDKIADEHNEKMYQEMVERMRKEHEERVKAEEEKALKDKCEKEDARKDGK